MGQIRRLRDLGFFDDHGDLDLRSGDHLDVDVTLGKGLEEFGCHTRVGAHADADNTEFGDAILLADPARSDLFGYAIEEIADLFEFVTVHCEGDVGAAAGGNVLDDHVDHDVGVGQCREEACGASWFVGDLADGDLGLIALDADAAHDDLFHSCGFFFHDGSWVVVKATADLEGHSKFLGEFDRTGLHHLGAAAGHLEHLVVGDRLDLSCRRDDAWVAGVDAVHISEDLAGIGIHGRSKSDGGEIRSTTSEGGDGPIAGLSLKSCDDDDLTLGEVLLDLVRGDVADLGLGVDAVGDDARLCSGEGDCLAAHALDRHGGEGHRGLLSRGEKDVHLALGGLAGNLAGQLDQGICDPRHRRNHGDNRVSRTLSLEKTLRDVGDALGIGDRGAAIFLDDERHEKEAVSGLGCRLLGLSLHLNSDANSPIAQ